MFIKMDQRDLILAETIAKLQTQLVSMTEEVSPREAVALEQKAETTCLA